MSKILKRNFLFKNFLNSYDKKLNTNKLIYNFCKKDFVYNKKDDAEEFGNKLKKLDEMYKEFDKNVDKLFEQEIKNPNAKKKQQKPIRITYVDMKNKKKTKEFLMDTGNKANVIEEKPEINTKNESSYNSESDSNVQSISGVNDSFPEENFVEIYSKQNTKNIKLHSYRYPATGNLKGVVYLLHGMFEHSNSNANVARVLSDRGYDVLSIDYRGHGKSEGKRGYIENMNVVLEDLKNFITATEDMYKDKTQNKFILGYSMGALYANLVSMTLPDYFNGLAMIAPPFAVDTKKYEIWLKIGNILRHIIPSLPLLRLKFNIKNKAISDYLQNDPLIYKGRLRIGTGLTLLESIKYSNDNLEKVTTPFYLLHGAKDKECNPQGSTIFYEKTKIMDKTIILHDSNLKINYLDYDHFITRHPDIERLSADIAFWMDMHSNR